MSAKAERQRVEVTKKWREPKPTKRELEILKRQGYCSAVMAMTHRLFGRSDGSTALAEVALNPYKNVHTGVPVDGINVVTRFSEPLTRKNGNRPANESPQDLVVEVVIGGRYFEVIREHIGCFSGSIGHHVTALGIKNRMHKELDGCDAAVVGGGKRQRFRRCTKARCLV